MTLGDLIRVAVDDEPKKLKFSREEGEGEMGCRWFVL